MTPMRNPCAPGSLVWIGLLAFNVLIGGCLSPPKGLPPGTLAPAKGRYPSHWWEPVSPQGAPAWEILPQAAGPGEVILSKRNELGLLSNFAATPFTFHARRYARVAGLWPIMKKP